VPLIRWPRVAVTAVIVVSLGLALTGCVATAGNIAVHALVQARSAAAVAGKPRAGECWQGTFKHADGDANWEGRPPVNCSVAHQLYTFAAPTLAKTHRGKLFDEKGYVYEAIWDDALDTCEGAESPEISNVDDTVARIYLAEFMPEEAQWDAGARWVRCDVGVIAVGSSVAHPSFDRMPSMTALNTAIGLAPAQFDFCVNDPGGVGSGGPKGSNAVYADCRDNPEWELQEYQSIIQGDDTSYPTPEQLKAQYELSCARAYADATHVTYAYYPSKSDWDSGYQQLECWVGRK
jgi:hypothetical protein